MRTIREILLTEYIGAILVALLLADAISTLFTILVTQLSIHLHPPPQMVLDRMPSPSYSILAAFIKIALYLLSAYLLGRWLYGKHPATTSESASPLP